MVRITVFTAASTLGNEYSAAELAIGVPQSRTVTTVNTSECTLSADKEPRSVIVRRGPSALGVGRHLGHRVIRRSGSKPLFLGSDPL